MTTKLEKAWSNWIDVLTEEISRLRASGDETEAALADALEDMDATSTAAGIPEIVIQVGKEFDPADALEVMEGYGYA
jgi:hypothetical protein